MCYKLRKIERNERRKPREIVLQLVYPSFFLVASILGI